MPRRIKIYWVIPPPPRGLLLCQYWGSLTAHRIPISRILGFFLEFSGNSNLKPNCSLHQSNTVMSVIFPHDFSNLRHWLNWNQPASKNRDFILMSYILIARTIMAKKRKRKKEIGFPWQNGSRLKVIIKNSTKWNWSSGDDNLVTRAWFWENPGLRVYNKKLLSSKNLDSVGLWW